MLLGSQSEQGIKINVLETPGLNCIVDANLRAANISVFPLPKSQEAGDKFHYHVKLFIKIMNTTKEEG